MRRFPLILALMLTLGGCVTTPRYVAGDGGDYYYDEPRAVGYMPDYFAYSAYYSALWPVYCPWWDAFCDSFHYGVTYFPNRYFGIGYHYGFGFAYSPWYGSWLDSYYDWNWWHYHRHYARSVASYRFGSAQNEARAVAMLSRDTTPMRASSLRARPSELGSSRGMGGATLRARSAPLGRETLPRRRDEMTDDRALDPYYGAPVRRSGGMDEGRLIRRAADADRSTARWPRSGSYDDPDEAGGPVRRNDATPRGWSRNEEVRDASARQDGHFGPRQESPRFVPRESSRDVAPGASAPMRSSPEPVMRSAPAPVTRSTPVSTPSPRVSRDDGNH